MTMPTLISKHRHKVYETQFKVAHSLVSQVITQIGNDNGDLNTYYCGKDLRNDATTHSFIKDFAKYVQIANSNFNSTGDLRILGYKKNAFYRSGKPTAIFNQDSHDDGAIILKNGMMLASSGCWWDSSMIDFVVDTNGVKGPNKFGYDVFYFQIGADNRLYPTAEGFSFTITEEESVGCCNFENSSACKLAYDTGTSCAQFALQNIYPQDKTKTYWDNLP